MGVGSAGWLHSHYAPGLASSGSSQEYSDLTKVSKSFDDEILPKSNTPFLDNKKRLDLVYRLLKTRLGYLEQLHHNA